MYSSLFRTFRLFWRGGRETRQHLNQLKRSQWQSKSELEQFQLAQIQRLVKHAYENIPYYRRRYQGLDIDPRDIKTLEDFQSLPLLTKQDVIDHLDEMVHPALRMQAQKVETGASTGEPMKFYVEDSFWWWNAAYEQRGREWHGVREGDKLAWVWGAYGDMSVGNWRASLKARLMRHKYLNAFDMTESNMGQFAATLLEWQPAFFRAYASMIYLFAQYLKQNQITGIRPKIIETTAEKLKPHQRQLVEEVFQCKVVDCYTAREFATIAYTCESGRMHVGETRYLELIDNGRVIEGDQSGTVVVTSLHQYLMPFIRYKLDDEAFFSQEDCPCGRSLPVLQEILGRTNDYIVASDNRYVHDGYFAIFFWSIPEVVRYQVYQPELNRLDIRLVCNQTVGGRWFDGIREGLKEHLGEEMSINVQVVDEIELTRSGKHRFIVSDVVESG